MTIDLFAASFICREAASARRTRRHARLGAAEPVLERLQRILSALLVRWARRDQMS